MEKAKFMSSRKERTQGEMIIVYNYFQDNTVNEGYQLLFLKTVAQEQLPVAMGRECRLDIRKRDSNINTDQGIWNRGGNPTYSHENKDKAIF